MFKKIIIVPLAFLLFLSAHASVLALTATDSGQTPDPDIQQNLKERVQKAAEKVKGITSNGVKKGFIGTVKRISEETLTFDTTRGTLIIPISDVVIVQNNKKMNVKDIEIGNAVTIIGYQNGEDFQAKRVIVSKTPLQPQPQTITVGTITKVDKTSITITTRGSTEQKVYSFDTKKIIFQDNKNEVIKSTDLEPQEDVIIVSVPENEATKSLNNSSGRAMLIRSLAAIEKR